MIDERFNLQHDTAGTVIVSGANPGGGSGSGSPPYDDTQIKADLAAEVTARTDGDAALDARITALPAPTPPYDDTAITAPRPPGRQPVDELDDEGEVLRPE